MPKRQLGGTDAAFARFIETHSRQLLHVARLLVGADAEDLLQGVLVRCYPRWRRIEQDDPFGYVRQALVNGATDRWRRRPRTEVTTDRVPEGPSSDAAPDVGARISLLAAMHQLTARERAVVVLRYFEDLTEVETARVLDLKVGTVKSLHHRALKKLRVSDELTDDADERTVPRPTPLAAAGQAEGSP